MTILFLHIITTIIMIIIPKNPQNDIIEIIAILIDADVFVIFIEKGTLSFISI